MNGPEHYRKAEEALDAAEAAQNALVPYHNEDHEAGCREIALFIGRAKTHALLAQVAATAAEQATAYDGDEYGRRSREWAGVA